MSEAEVMDACFDYLIWQGFLVVRVNSGVARPERADGTIGYVEFYRWQALGLDRQTAGLVDLLGFRPDMRICVECKRPGKRGNVSDAQKAFLAAWSAAGGISLVACSIDDLRPIVEGKEVIR